MKNILAAGPSVPFHAALAARGYRGAAVPMERLGELRTAFEALLLSEELDGAARRIAERFLRPLPDAAALGFAPVSAVVVAAPSPLVRLDFGGTRVDMPPTYAEFGTLDGELVSFLSEALPPYRFADAAFSVPRKALAVRAGLAEYGRNHLCYIPGMGSFFRLGALFTDMPAGDTGWRAARTMGTCAACGLCERLCPTGALSGGSALRVERCLTHYNEDFGDLPDWIGADAHNALVGCMRCQADCPQNGEAVRASGPEAAFSPEETDALLAARAAADVPAAAQAKLASVGLAYDDYFRDVLSRNLRLLLNRPKAAE